MRVLADFIHACSLNNYYSTNSNEKFNIHIPLTAESSPELPGEPEKHTRS